MRIVRALFAIAFAAAITTTANSVDATLVNARPAQQQSVIGIAVDNLNDSIVVFDATTDTVLHTVPGGVAAGTFGDCAITRDQTRAYVTTFIAANAVIAFDLTTSPPTVMTTIPMTTQAIDATISRDEQYLIVSNGTAAASPITVVDIATNSVVGTLTPGTNRNSVVACDDAASSVLYTDTISNGTHRLTINGAGALAPANEQSIHPGSDPNNAVCGPGGVAGVTILRDGVGTMHSYLVNGMTAVNTAQAGGFGINVDMSPDGSRVFGRGGALTRGFDFDPNSGQIGAQLFQITGIASPTFFGMDQMAHHPVLDKLYISSRRQPW
jgi:DNA-binding beta-propeller fold protein YncE